MKPTSQADFLVRLQAEAALQAKLEHHRLLPAQLDGITSFIGRYAWPVLLALSGLTAAVIEITRGWT